MTLLDSFLLGIIEGLSEFLPISSTGHLILSSYVFGIEKTDFLKTFEISIQLGAILAVVFLYWKNFLLNINILKKIVVAFTPTAIGGLLLYSVFKNFLLENELIVLAALFFGGIFLILFELMYKERETATNDIANISFKNAFLIGCFQLISMIPGVSRAAATIIGGMILGLKRKTIVEFSFLLAVPTMAAATFFDLYKNPNVFEQGNILPLLIGFLTSFFVAIFAIKWLLHYIQNHNFIAFGVYRIIISVLFWIIFF